MARRDLRRAIFSEGENVMVQTDVAIAACPDYSGENVRLALEQVLDLSAEWFRVLFVLF